MEVLAYSVAIFGPLLELVLMLAWYSHCHKKIFGNDLDAYKAWRESED